MTWHKGNSGNPNGRKPGTGKVARLRASIEKQLPAILEALTAGNLAPGQAAALLQGLAALAKLVELDDLTRRIEALEGKPT